jgi:hypothetical protein
LSEEGQFVAAPPPYCLERIGSFPAVSKKHFTGSRFKSSRETFENESWTKAPHCACTVIIAGIIFGFANLATDGIGTVPIFVAKVDTISPENGLEKTLSHPLRRRRIIATVNDDFGNETVSNHHNSDPQSDGAPLRSSE